MVASQVLREASQNLTCRNFQEFFPLIDKPACVGGQGPGGALEEMWLEGPANIRLLRNTAVAAVPAWTDQCLVIEFVLVLPHVGLGWAAAMVTCP